MNYLNRKLTAGKISFTLPELLWVLLPMAAAVAEISHGVKAINNYFIFKGVSIHLFNQQSLYIEYPLEYFDTNHSGPLFGLLMAPFAYLPDTIGCLLWSISNITILLFAIKRLPLKNESKQLILLIGTIELMTSLHSVQFNPMAAAWIILSFYLVEKGKDFWANFLIVAGILVKIYGVVGVLFFFFSKRKKIFIISFLFWLILLFCLPMLFTSPQYILSSYTEWMNSLIEKNYKNIHPILSDYMQDMSIMGMIRRIFGYKDLGNAIFLIPAALLYVIPLLRRNCFQSLRFRLYYLSLALMGVVIFSSSAESPTFVIAVTGAAIWFVLQKPSTLWQKALLGLMMVLTCLATTDLMPGFLWCNFIKPYSLKVLPCFLIWLVVLWELLARKFQNEELLIV